MTSQPVRAAAAALSDRLRSAAQTTLDELIVVAVLGPAGSGRSGVLAAAAEVAAATGRRCQRADDVHHLDDEQLAALERDAETEILLVSWVEPYENRVGLGRFARRAGRQNLLVHLGQLGEDELANGVATLLGAPPDRSLTDWLTRQSGGQAWLVHATLSALRDTGRVTRGRFTAQPPSPDDPALVAVHERIRAELRALPANTRPAVAAMVADSEPATLAEIAIAAPQAWQALCAAGLVLPSGVPPLVLAAAQGLLTPAERAEGHQTASQLLARRGVSPLVRAEHAWAGRSGHVDAAQNFLDAGYELLGDDPRAAAAWFDRAGAAAADPPTALAARGAQAEALVLAGDLAGAVELADFVLGRDATEAHAAAAFAMASARRGRWLDVAHWSARIAGHQGVADSWWWWQQQAALLVSGRLAEVETHLAGVDLHQPVTPVVGQLREAVLVLRASLHRDRDELLAARRSARSLIGAQALSRPPMVAAVRPAELLAVAALALGEPEGARQAFVGAGQAPFGARRSALARWAVLRCGDTVRPVDEGAAGAASGVDDDALDPVALAVNAALARRSGDVAATGAVARQLPRLLSVLQVDLFNLDAVTELLLVARRFSTPSVAEEFDDAIETFLAAIGRAPAWTARWHWAQLEAAIMAGQTAAIDAPARALAATAAVLPGINVLADAASVWLQVLGGNPDPATLDAAVRDLRTAGYVWEAAQLAGQAAIRVEDATLAKSLLGQARSLRGSTPSAAAVAAASAQATGAVGGRDDGAVTPAGLSDREVEVARLVLNGLTHKAIGATLYISPKTVEHHVAHIRQKLGATNRAEFLAALREDLAASSDF